MNQFETVTIERIVRCPTCAGVSVYSTTNVARPFCSSRCKNVDLGAWASEEFRVSTTPEVNDTDSDNAQLQ